MPFKLAQTIQELSPFFNPQNYGEEGQKILRAVSLAPNSGVLVACQITKGKECPSLRGANVILGLLSCYIFLGDQNLSEVVIKEQN